MIRVMLVDDHQLVRKGIKTLIEATGDLVVVGEAEDGHQAIRSATHLLPDVMVMDISMPGMNGIHVLEQMTALGLPTKVMFLTMHANRSMVRRALQCGAKGYLVKSAAIEELLIAIRAVNQGNTYLSPSISTIILADVFPKAAYTDTSLPIEQLSSRELEVFKLIVEGHTNKQTAGFLHISMKTVEKHRANVMTKLGVHDLVGLVRMAIKFDLISLDA
jgi:DNA-binding NarL/FixJ family response regulator